MDKSLPDTKPFAPFEWMLAGRYLRARRREGFISVISLFSFLGILLGVATLIVVMAVLNGFRAELLDKILGFQGHVSVYNSDLSPIHNYADLQGRIELVALEGSSRGAGQQGQGAAALELREAVGKLEVRIERTEALGDIGAEGERMTIDAFRQRRRGPAMPRPVSRPSPSAPSGWCSAISAPARSTPCARPWPMPAAPRPRPGCWGWCP